MSVLLNQPKMSKTLDRARIAAFKFEDNVAQGQRWIEIWITIGKREIDDDDSSFQQYVDPENGKEVYQYVKLENGLHPLAPTQALRKCSECGAWTASVICKCDSEEHTVPYDGASRFILAEHEGALKYSNFKKALYHFLITEEVPHPSTGVMVRLLDAQED